MENQQDHDLPSVSQLLLAHRYTRPVQWEDEECANWDLEVLRAEFRARLYPPYTENPTNSRVSANFLIGQNP